jgi:hypothetical protein
LAGAVDNAERLLAIRKAFKWHKDEQQILKAVLRSHQDTAVSADHLSGFDGYFDLTRNPGFKPRVFVEAMILPFELSILCQLYLTAASTTAEIHWDRVVEAVRA